MCTSYRRRNVLRLSIASLAVAVAGCARRTETMADISVFNETTETLRGKIRAVRRTDGHSVLAKSFELSPDDPENLIRFDDPISKSGVHTVTVELDDERSEQWAWDVPSAADERQDERYALVITIHATEIRFEQVSDTSD